MAAALVSQENVVASLVSRTGRHLQRYNKGRRQVVGCVPYRYKVGNPNSLEGEDELQVLVISSQKGKGLLFPKGGWELDETITQAAQRETYEEAGVKGIVERQLGEWTFQSRTHGTDYEGFMFPLLVTEVSAREARECCQHWWMKEALDVLVDRLAGRQQLDEEEVVTDDLTRPEHIEAIRAYIIFPMESFTSGYCQLSPCLLKLKTKVQKIELRNQSDEEERLL
ncbi:unnamed protein product [Dovyalis caffra]|uniref:Nudix hydrolase domain-containing protein n=1 Tax=Dovyalis caffra TaxID=77055 RepID=A0AAV1RQM4_9ROSI|nr:unnamed protein product [Dovyalis caffra]